MPMNVPHAQAELRDLSHKKTLMSHRPKKLKLLMCQNENVRNRMCIDQNQNYENQIWWKRTLWKLKQNVEQSDSTIKGAQSAIIFPIRLSWNLWLHMLCSSHSQMALPSNKPWGFKLKSEENFDGLFAPLPKSISGRQFCNQWELLYQIRIVHHHHLLYLSNTMSVILRTLMLNWAFICFEFTNLSFIRLMCNSSEMFVSRTTSLSSFAPLQNFTDLRRSWSWESSS